MIDCQSVSAQQLRGSELTTAIVFGHSEHLNGLTTHLRINCGGINSIDVVGIESCTRYRDWPDVLTSIETQR